MNESLSTTTSSAPPPGVDPFVGRVIASKYELEVLLGAGAMGAVYKARQQLLDKTVAIKILHSSLTADPAFAGRFHREAQVASRFDHPNSIQVFDYGVEPDGVLYIAMEYVEGRDLFAVIEERGPLPPAAIVDVMLQALGAVAAAHTTGVLHRDLKPENIMVVRAIADDGTPCERVKVCDFGIAKLMGEAAAPASERAGSGPNSKAVASRKLSTAGLVIGTPAYMSPEQVRGAVVDARSDLYSMGIILYQLLTARVPFEGDTAMDIAVKQINEAPPPPSRHLPAVNAELEAICLKAIAKDPAARYQDAREMRKAIRGVAVDGTSALLTVVVGRTDRTSFAQAETLAMPLSDVVPGTVASSPPPDTLAAEATALTPETRPSRTSSRAAVAVAALACVCASAWFMVQRTASPPLRADDAPSSPVVAQAALAKHGPPVAAQPAPTHPEVATPARDPVPLATHEPSPPSTPAVVVPRSAQRSPLREKEPPAPTVVAVAAPPTPPVPEPPPPAPTAVVAAPAPPPVPPPAPAPPAPLDVTSAHVDLGAVSNVAATAPTNVLRGLSGIDGKLTSCYRGALPSMSPPAEGSFTLHIETDDDGTVTDAVLRGAPPALSHCFAAAAVGRKVPNVDTGRASADVALVLRLH